MSATLIDPAAARERFTGDRVKRPDDEPATAGMLGPAAR
jgi:hypothetical protein